MSLLAGYLNYVAIVALMMGGLFIVFSAGNLIKRMIGIGLFQSAAGLFFITLGKVSGGTAAITLDARSEAGKALAAQLPADYVQRFGVEGVVYSNPLPHVLILTAIVVGVATLAVGLAIAVRIREAFGTVEGPEIARMCREQDAETPEADTPR
jgi:multicomponent Na+:H+ antiporter subunit C